MHKNRVWYFLKTYNAMGKPDIYEGVKGHLTRHLIIENKEAL